jgi:hypothetical protein
MIDLSDRELNLIVAGIDLVDAALRGGDAHVTDWYHGILLRTTTPLPAARGELLELRRKLTPEGIADGCVCARGGRDERGCQP